MTAYSAVPGIHLAADPAGPPPYHWPYENDWLTDEIAKMRLGAAFGWVTTPDDVLRRVLQSLQEPFLFVYRLDIMPENDRTVSVLLDRFMPHLERLVGQGHVYLQPHNEPNIYTEGLERWYEDGREYAGWLVELRDEIKRRLPRIQFGFPPMSPGYTEPQTRVDELVFIDQMRLAGVEPGHFDWIAVHDYWINEYGIGPAIHRVTKYAERYPKHIVMVTEFGNLATDLPAVKAEQYTRWFKAMRVRPDNLLASFMWVLWSSGTIFKDHIIAGTDIPQLLEANEEWTF